MSIAFPPEELLSSLYYRGRGRVERLEFEAPPGGFGSLIGCGAPFQSQRHGAQVQLDSISTLEEPGIWVLSAQYVLPCKKSHRLLVG